MFVECIEGCNTDSISVDALEDSYLFSCCSESFKRRPDCMKPGFIAEMLDRVASVRVFVFREQHFSKSQRANIKLKLVPYYDTTPYGGKQPNGSWTGMLGRVERNEVDMFVADFTPSAGRMEDFVFTPPFVVNREAVRVSSYIDLAFDRSICCLSQACRSN